MRVKDSLLLRCLNTFIWLAMIMFTYHVRETYASYHSARTSFFSFPFRFTEKNKECNINGKANMPKRTSTPSQPMYWKGTSSRQVTFRNLHSSTDINKMQCLKGTLRLSHYNLHKYTMFRNIKSMKGEDYFYDHYNIPWHWQNKEYFPDMIRKEVMWRKENQDLDLWMKKTFPGNIYIQHMSWFMLQTFVEGAAVCTQ